MDAIRFEPTIVADFALDRRQSSSGDLFADMLGDQLKKRSESERAEPLVRRRPSVDRRQAADPHGTQGRPIRPVIKHPHTIRGEAKPAGEEQPQIAGRKEAVGDGMESEQAASAVAPADQHSDAPAASEAPEATPAEALPNDAAAPVAAEAAEEAPATVTIAILPAETVVVPANAEAGSATEPAEGMAQDAVTPAAAAPAELAAPAPAEGESAAAAGDDSAAPSAASFAAALAASQAETAAAALGDDMDAAPAEARTAQAAGLTAEQAAALAELSAKAEADTRTTATPGDAAETDAQNVALTAKMTPEAPRAADPAKPRHAGNPPQAEIRMQSAPAPSPQPQAPVQPAPQAPSAGLGDGSATTFEAAAFDGDGVTMPGWALHLAQGAAAKRPDFVAQLRQHLQDLPAHEQVAVNIQRALREGTGRVSIQLSPAELGQIHVKLDIDEEKRVTAAVTVEKPSTLELLQRDMKALERALHDAGLKMEGNDLSFSLARQDGQEFSQDLGNSSRSGFGGSVAEDQAEMEAEAGPAAQIDTAAGMVNLEV